MSSIQRDTLEAHEDTARRIQRFLWEGKPFKSEPIHHTEEEYRDFLISLRDSSWTYYDDGKDAIG